MTDQLFVAKPASGVDEHEVGRWTAEERREALRQLLTRKYQSDERPAADALPTVIPDLAGRHQPFPLTPIQQAYWLGRDPSFSLGGVGIHGYFELECIDLDVARLEAAWNMTVARHDMLRTIVLADGTGKILEHVPPYRIQCIDARAMPPDAQEQARQLLRSRMSHQVFDVGRWPIFELHAVRLDERRTRLHYSEDAIHLDMRSSAIVANDWLQLYRDQNTQLKPLTLSYRDYAIAIERHAGSDRYLRARQYWERRAADLPDPPDLPLSASLGSVEMTFIRRGYTLDAQSWSKLKQQAAARNLTPADVLLALYAEVLGTWSSSQRFLLNVTVQNRLAVHEEVVDITGDFTSFTLLEVMIGSSSSFAERALQYRDQLWRDLEHDAVSGVTVLREVARIRGRSDFVVPFVFTCALGTAGYRAVEGFGRIEHEVTQTPQVLLDQQALECEGALVLSWDVVDSAFPPGLIDEMFAHLQSRLTELCDSTACWQHNSALRIPAAQRRVRDAMNQTEAVFDRDRLESAFQRRAKHAPHATAIIDEFGTLTYSQLDEASSCLAARLQSESPCVAERIGVAIPKGRAQIVAVLAILKTGGIYVPLDVTQPPVRLERIARAAKCSMVLVTRTGAPISLRCLCVDEEADEPIAPYSQPDLEASAGAYVLFTSGSTGEPKGVVITHDAVMNRMVDVVQRFNVRDTDRAFALTGLHHDLSVFDIFGMLAVAGGTVVMPSQSLLNAPSRWPEFVRNHGITIWNSVPAFLQMALTYIDHSEAALSSIRLALISGDVIPRDLPVRTRVSAPHARFISLGGPTETTVWDICYEVDDLPASWDTIPYGTPMRNARYYVLREDLSECPDWVAGELYISGVGVTPGYVNDDELSRTRFVRHPSTGERLYRSGDRGRMRAEGLVEILGRVDRQVKLSGHRVELGEIEAALRAIPQVENAVAWMNDQRSSGGRVLAAVTGTVATNDVNVTRFPFASHGAPSLVAHRGASARQFASKPVPLQAFMHLMSCFADQPGTGAKRRHPSAGACYAVDVFVAIETNRVEGLAGGLYALDLERAQLILEDSHFYIEPHHHAPWNQAVAAGAAFTVLLVADKSLLEDKYGGRARDLLLVESGYIGQMAICAANELGLATCPIGGLHLDSLETVLCRTSRSELLHCIVGGMPVDQNSANVPRTTPRPESKPRRVRLTPESLRKALAQLLPSHMIPAEIVVADELPTTSNGKIDRARLDALIVHREVKIQVTHQPAARAEVEVRSVIVNILAKVLQNPSIPEDRALHELGANSMHLANLHAKLSQLGHRLEMVDVFRYPTVAALAEFIANGSGQFVEQGAQPQMERRRQAIKHLRGRRDVE